MVRTPAPAASGAGPHTASATEAITPARLWRRRAIWGCTGLVAFGLTIVATLRHPSSPPPARQVTLAAVTVPPPQPALPPLPGSVMRDCPTCPEMVLIPHGSFTMGVPQEESELGRSEDSDARPLHRVTIVRDFYLGKYAIIKAEFAAFVADAGPRPAGRCMPMEPWEPDGDWRNPGFTQTDRDPVVCVNAPDAEAYAAWLTHKTGKPYHLPSEAEWEYAARAGTATARFWGDGPKGACQYANVSDRSLMARLKMSFDTELFFGCDDGFVFTAPVGSFAPNDFGLYDMLGNVYQWTADPGHDDYRGAPNDGSAWTTKGDDARRVQRGGSWSSVASDVRAGSRDAVRTGLRDSWEGFRLARTLLPP